MIPAPIKAGWRLPGLTLRAEAEAGVEERMAELEEGHNAHAAGKLSGWAAVL